MLGRPALTAQADYLSDEDRDGLDRAPVYGNGDDAQGIDLDADGPSAPADGADIAHPCAQMPHSTSSVSSRPLSWQPRMRKRSSRSPIRSRRCVLRPKQRRCE